MIDTDQISWVSVFTLGDNGRYSISPEYWDELDAAFSHWIERKIDKVLCLTTLDGAAVRMPASRIGELLLSTPEYRARCRELEAALKAESGFSGE